MRKSKYPKIIAEVSANHCRSFKLAKKIIFEAKKYGADYVKLQTFSPDEMTINSNKSYFLLNQGLWKGYNLWQLYNEAQTPLKWHKPLFQYAKKLGIKIFSTPFDEKSVDFLEKLNCPIYKVASFEMTDLPLIKKIAKTKKPMIISTGMSNIDEIELTYKTAKRNGAKDITLLYCVSNYPADKQDFNLKNIKILKEKFNCKVGLSDHSNGSYIAKLASNYGLEYIEKHFAAGGQKKGLDIKFSLKGQELRAFKRDVFEAIDIHGKNNFIRKKNESEARIFRRSIFIIDDIKKGQKFSKKNIKIVRPGFGIAPLYFEKIINKKSPYNLKKYEPLKMNVIKALKLN